MIYYLAGKLHVSLDIFRRNRSKNTANTSILHTRTIPCSLHLFNGPTMSVYIKCRYSCSGTDPSFNILVIECYSSVIIQKEICIKYFSFWINIFNMPKMRKRYGENVEKTFIDLACFFCTTTFGVRFEGTCVTWMRWCKKSYQSAENDENFFSLYKIRTSIQIRLLNLTNRFPALFCTNFARLPFRRDSVSTSNERVSGCPQKYLDARNTQTQFIRPYVKLTHKPTFTYVCSRCSNEGIKDTVRRTREMEVNKRKPCWHFDLHLKQTLVCKIICCCRCCWDWCC